MTREEAIDVVRNIYQTDKEKEALEALIPELRESEEERIRNEILLYIGSKQDIDLDTHNRWCDWLEKQKEQKPSFKQISNSVIWDSGPRTGIELGKKEQKTILEVFGFKVGDAVRLKDGDGRKHIIKSFEEVEGIHGPNFYQVEFEDNSARDGIYPGEEYPNGYYTQMEKFEEEQKPVEGDNETEIQKAFREGKSAGRKEVFDHPEEYGLQKPEEWSKQSIIDALTKWLTEKIAPLHKKSLDGTITEREEMFRVALLEMRSLVNGPDFQIGKDTSAEWSEEDEKMIMKIISSLRGYITTFGSDPRNHEAYIWKEINWLKSLRSHCNPSKEQMEDEKEAKEGM